MTSTAERLANWANDYVPTADDLALANRSLLDTVAVALGARESPLRPVVSDMPDAGRWSALAHVLDFDDLHMESTTHVSAVCVPAVLASGGEAGAYLAAAGAMARLGTALGWAHYRSGWHATCTAGAPAAAIGAARSLGLDRAQTAAAIALAVPAAGGVQRAFGSSGKSLQVGFAADAGVRAAQLVAAGADADPSALDQWLTLVGGDPDALDLSGPAIPGGLAIKVFPCCYAMQRPIAAVRALLATAQPDGHRDITRIREIRVTAPEATVHPLIHHRPRTGLEGKFSLEYAVATALIDDYPGIASFTTDAVMRPTAQRLINRTSTTLIPGGTGLLDGETGIELVLSDGHCRNTELDLPPGSPARPVSEADLTDKAASCGADIPRLIDGIDWRTAATVLRQQLPAGGTQTGLILRELGRSDGDIDSLRTRGLI